MTVRVCGECHDLWSKGDEILKFMAASGLRRSQSAKELSAEVNRSLARNAWWKKEIQESARGANEIRIDVGRGLEPGFKFTISGEVAEAIDRSVTRIAMGLLFSQVPELDTTELKFEVVQGDEEHFDRFVSGL